MVYEGHFYSREQGQMKQNRTRRVELFDTSLRDGLQQPNLDISVPNAVGLLDRMGYSSQTSTSPCPTPSA